MVSVLPAILRDAPKQYLNGNGLTRDNNDNGTIRDDNVAGKFDED